MVSRTRLAYHLGWVVGVVMVGYGGLSMAWTLDGRAGLDPSGWQFLTWLALLQTVVGVAWLLSWYLVDRHRVGERVEG